MVTYPHLRTLHSPMGNACAIPGHDTKLLKYNNFQTIRKNLNWINF